MESRTGASQPGASRTGTSRTVVDSVKLVDSPPTNLEAINLELLQLRARFPGVILERYLGHRPQIANNVRIAQGSAIVGKVELAAQVSIWYGCVLRGDVNQIEVRERSNLQDGTVVHVGDRDKVLVAEEVVVGHRAVLHGCRIGGGCLIGIGATILDGAEVGEGSVIGSGALVLASVKIPPRSLVVGSPARVIRTLTAEDEKFHRDLAAKYIRLAHNYQHG